MGSTMDFLSSTFSSEKLRKVGGKMSIDYPSVEWDSVADSSSSEDNDSNSDS